MIEQVRIQIPVDVDAFQAYLKANLTSDLVLQVLEECLVEENGTYASLDFEKALANLQRRDTGRYYMLKLLLEGYATKEGQVLLDPKLVSASYKQRMKQLEFLKSMGRLRRFCYRLAQAVVSLFSEKNETEAIQEAIQVTGEVQIARDELHALELKRQKVIEETNEIQVRTSDERRRKLEEADRLSTEKVETIHREARGLITGAHKQVEGLNRQAEQIREEITALSRERFRLKEGAYSIAARD